MIKFIEPEVLLPLRNELLRGGRLTLDECRFPTDKINGAFHLGYYVDEQLVSIASLSPQNYDGFTGQVTSYAGWLQLKNTAAGGLATNCLTSL